jgi:4-hydroxy-tetrahydrodipicolinate reductase
MINVILNGCNGRMGIVMQNMIAGTDDMKVVAGIDAKGGEGTAFPIFTTPAECTVKGDVVIDFSHYAAIPALIEYCRATKTPVVIGTTALDEACLKLADEASNEIPVFRSANMSLGINALIKAIQSVMPVLEKDYNVEIIEKHHTKKVDSPSGTAILLADAVSDACDVKKDYIYGRHSKADEFKMTNIGIHAVRGGTIPGEHTVMFAGTDEIIEFKHTALSRDIFAGGAVAAARFVAGKTKGYYSMKDMF